MLSDFSSNFGLNPMVAARQMKAKGVPVVTVGLGTENAGAGSRDVMLRDIVAGPTVFVKNNLEVHGNLVARGFANKELEVELYVEDMPVPVAQHQGQGPRREQPRPDQGPRVQAADARREEDHAQGRRARRRAAQVQQRDQHVRLGPERRAQRAVPPGLELHAGTTST